ncbi:2-C-methyl-D-erythritol 4-phosphate cytidylyltransferase [Brevibacterium daeguense]|uniref:2-C-methyl-D-erythritol 4-phosphate cytidylyltransferase n=1 Tax=Brevibacterium daeguense TaxID=909936 RepID=A0ABP8EGQ7_9MICO|nr:2-C-methyl-D-erythritol 4-phosphate cytidylyltransferase [Brevibacterium daeguense]
MGIPKAFVEIAGVTLLERSVLGALASGAAAHVVAAVPEALVSAAADALAARVRAAGLDPSTVDVVVGGEDRVASVQAALEAVGSCSNVLVHDAARCLTPPAVFTRVVAALRAGAAGVVPALPMTDTVKRVAGRGPAGGEALVSDLDRSTLRRVQTPQGFPLAILQEAHRLQRADPNPAATDDAMLVERLGHVVEVVAGDERAFKITHPIDMRLAELYVGDSEPDAGPRKPGMADGCAEAPPKERIE